MAVAYTLTSERAKPRRRILFVLALLCGCGGNEHGSGTKGSAPPIQVTSSEFSGAGAMEATAVRDAGNDSVDTNPRSVIGEALPAEFEQVQLTMWPGYYAQPAGAQCDVQHDQNMFGLDRTNQRLEWNVCYIDLPTDPGSPHAGSRALDAGEFQSILSAYSTIHVVAPTCDGPTDGPTGLLDVTGSWGSKGYSAYDEQCQLQDRTAIDDAAFSALFQRATDLAKVSW